MVLISSLVTVCVGYLLSLIEFVNIGDVTFTSQQFLHEKHLNTQLKEG